MEEFMEIIYEELPKHLMTFLETLTGNELKELNKIDKHLIARVYQAGAVFSIEVLNELRKAGK